MLENVHSVLYVYHLDKDKWRKEKVDIPELGTVSIVDADDDSDKFFYSYYGFLTPTSLFFADTPQKKAKEIRHLPAFFNTDGLTVKQNWATSKDGTKIPYFIVSQKDLKYDSQNPTLLYGYGGFEISMKPRYSATIGVDWLEKGGVFVLANIRGGGEFGPKWHLSALKENRQRAYDDFAAVAEDLIHRKITSPQHLGIKGGSNGGLLVGVAFTQRADLYNAVVCRVPLLDMKRFNKLLAGASWMGEYGNPDKAEEWAYIKKYSPYQNIFKDKKYPQVFFNTSTRDDRVHPGHARKMVAKMESLGYPVYYYENMEGGHAAATTNKQSAYQNALIYSYLWKQLK
jgi:prolyl oligopeptidase